MEPFVGWAHDAISFPPASSGQAGSALRGRTRQPWKIDRSSGVSRACCDWPWNCSSVSASHCATAPPE